MKNNYQRKEKQEYKSYSPREIVELYKREKIITGRECAEMLEESLDDKLFGVLGSHRDYYRGKINQTAYCELLSRVLEVLPVNSDCENKRSKTRT